MGAFTFDDSNGIPEWEAELFHVQADTAAGVISAEEFDHDRGTWDDVHGNDVRSMLDGDTEGFDPVLVAMVRAADKFLTDGKG